MSERWPSWLLGWLPGKVAEAPERVMLNVGIAAIGLSGLLGLLIGEGPRPTSLLVLWPPWLSYEWSAAMVLGGCCALYGYLRQARSVERLGYLAACAATALYGVSAVIVLGYGGVFPAFLYLGIAASKVIRLAVTAEERASHIRGGQDEL